MTEQPKSPRDQLTNLLNADNADTADFVAMIATVMVKEVLPALDQMKQQVEKMRWRFGCVEMALAEISIIYSHLQDLVPPHKNSPLAKQRVEWQERLENALRRLEEAAA